MTITLAYDYKPDVWLPVPTSFPHESASTVEQWAAGPASRARERGRLETRDSGTLDSYYIEVAKVAGQYGIEHDNVWLLEADDAPGVVLLVIDVVEAAGSLNDVIAEYAAPAASQYEPATVVRVDAAGIGEGCYVLRKDIAPDRRVNVTVNFVFRVRDYDIVIATQSYDALAIDWAVPRIHELIDGISVVDVERAQ